MSATGLVTGSRLVPGALVIPPWEATRLTSEMLGGLAMARRSPTRCMRQYPRHGGESRPSIIICRARRVVSVGHLDSLEGRRFRPSRGLARIFVGPVHRERWPGRRDDPVGAIGSCPTRVVPPPIYLGSARSSPASAGRGFVSGPASLIITMIVARSGVRSFRWSLRAVTAGLGRSRERSLAFGRPYCQGSSQPSEPSRVVLASGCL